MSESPKKRWRNALGHVELHGRIGSCWVSLLDAIPCRPGDELARQKTCLLVGVSGWEVGPLPRSCLLTLDINDVVTLGKW